MFAEPNVIHVWHRSIPPCKPAWMAATRRSTLPRQHAGHFTPMATPSVMCASIRLRAWRSTAATRAESNWTATELSCAGRRSTNVSSPVHRQTDDPRRNSCTIGAVPGRVARARRTARIELKGRTCPVRQPPCAISPGLARDGHGRRLAFRALRDAVDFGKPGGGGAVRRHPPLAARRQGTAGADLGGVGHAIALELIEEETRHEHA